MRRTMQSSVGRQEKRGFEKPSTVDNNLMRLKLENAVEISYYGSAYTMYRTAARQLKAT